MLISMPACPRSRSIRGTTMSNDIQLITQPIIRGHSERGYPSVCLVTLVSNIGLRYTCTGTLISPDLVLCAAHCVDAPRIHSATCDFEGRSVPALRWFWSRDFKQSAIEYGRTEHQRLLSVGDDFTVIQLALPIFDIQPSPMMRRSVFRQLHKQNAIRELTAVGFGRYSKYETTNILAGVEKRSAVFKKFSFPKGTQTIKVRPSERREGEPVSIAVGDSGGPYFARYKGVNYIVATTSTVTYDDNGDADFATALCVDAAINFFKSSLFEVFSQSVGPNGYGYVRPYVRKVGQQNIEKIIVDENKCLHGYCVRESPILFGSAALLCVTALTTLTFRIKNAEITKG